MPYTGFDPGNFGAAAGFPNHYTAWSTIIPGVKNFVSKGLNVLNSTKNIRKFGMTLSEEIGWFAGYRIKDYRLQETPWPEMEKLFSRKSFIRRMD